MLGPFKVAILFRRGNNKSTDQGLVLSNEDDASVGRGEERVESKDQVVD